MNFCDTLLTELLSFLNRKEDKVTIVFRLRVSFRPFPSTFALRSSHITPITLIS